MGATTDRREGGGQSTLRACAQPVAVEFLLLLFFAQTKEKKGTPPREKEAPQRYLPPGGFAFLITEHVPINIGMITPKQIPCECIKIYIVTNELWDLIIGLIKELLCIGSLAFPFPAELVTEGF